MQETQVWSLGQEDPLEEGMRIHSNILAWKIPWTEKPGGLQSIGSQRVGHNWSDYADTHIHLCFQLYGHPVNFHVSVAMEFIQQKLIVLHINKYTVCLEKVPAYQILTWSLSLWYEKWNWFFLINYSMFSVKISQSRPTLCNPMGWMVHGVLQARILEWVAFPYSRGSSQPRDQTQVSHIAGRFFTSWATREAQEYWSGSLSLLQQIFPTQELKQVLLHCRWILPVICDVGYSLWFHFTWIWIAQVEKVWGMKNVNKISIRTMWNNSAFPNQIFLTDQNFPEFHTVRQMNHRPHLGLAMWRPHFGEWKPAILCALCSRLARVKNSPFV